MHGKTRDDTPRTKKLGIQKKMISLKLSSALDWAVQSAVLIIVACGVWRVQPAKFITFFKKDQHI